MLHLIFSGLVVLPVILSFIGPKPNTISSTPSESEEENTLAQTKENNLEHMNGFAKLAENQSALLSDETKITD